MLYRHFSLIFVLCVACTVLLAQPRQRHQRRSSYLADSVLCHDPVMAVQGDTAYLFSTGMGIQQMRSTDGMQRWSYVSAAIRDVPQWTHDAVPGFRGHMWAPDIIRHEGQWHLFYSCSAFGKNTSAIGHATSPTLNPEAPDYGWTDRGMIVQSVPGRDMWNAIDPNIIIDADSIPWMTFGSFWNGIKLVRLKADLSALHEPQEWHTICRRPRTFTVPDAQAGDAALEAPFIIRRGDYYYLLVSYDYCCRGAQSDYKVVVGRAKNVRGPYIDREGRRMDHGGGTLLVQGNQRYAGIGHCSAYEINGRWYYVSHAYDQQDGGQAHLYLRPMQWDVEGWPQID